MGLKMGSWGIAQARGMGFVSNKKVEYLTAVYDSGKLVSWLGI